MNGSFEIREFVENGRSPYAEWHTHTLDSVTAERVEQTVRGGWNFELRLDFGPGYRVYFGRAGRALIILLGGGSKRRQDADIAAAVERWKRYKQTKR